MNETLRSKFLCLSVVVGALGARTLTARSIQDGSNPKSKLIGNITVTLEVENPDALSIAEGSTFQLALTAVGVEGPPQRSEVMLRELGAEFARSGKILPENAVKLVREGHAVEVERLKVAATAAAVQVTPGTSPINPPPVVTTHSPGYRKQFTAGASLARANKELPKNATAATKDGFNSVEPDKFAGVEPARAPKAPAKVARVTKPAKTAKAKKHPASA